MLLNEITFAGNLGQDADDATLQSGTRIVSFSLCHNEKGKDGRPDKQTWVRAKVFGNWCELAATFKKGDNVFIKGRLDINVYKDKNGVERTSVDVIPFTLGRIEREQRGQDQQQQRSTQGQATRSSAPRNAPPPSNDIDMEDIPF